MEFADHICLLKFSAFPPPSGVKISLNNLWLLRLSVSFYIPLSFLLAQRILTSHACEAKAWWNVGFKLRSPQFHCPSRSQEFARLNKDLQIEQKCFLLCGILCKKKFFLTRVDSISPTTRCCFPILFYFCIKSWAWKVTLMYKGPFGW